MLCYPKKSNKCVGSAIYYFSDDQKRLAVATRDRFNALLKEADLNPTTTEIAPASDYYFAEEYREYLISLSTLFVLHASPGQLTK